MKQIIIQLETPEIQALEKAGDKIAIAKVKRIFISILSSLYGMHMQHWA